MLHLLKKLPYPESWRKAQDEETDAFNELQRVNPKNTANWRKAQLQYMDKARKLNNGALFDLIHYRIHNERRDALLIFLAALSIQGGFFTALLKWFG